MIHQFKIVFVIAIFCIAIQISNAASFQRNNPLRTNHHNDCVRVKPANVKNVGVLMGDYFGIDRNSTTLKICEKAKYSSTGYNTFDVVYQMLYNGTWIALSGNGTMFAPGVNRAELVGEESLNGVYTFIGTDYENYFVLYSCINNNPAVAIETKSTNPPDSVWESAYQDILNNGMTLDYINTATNNC